jgi:NodT family efflux transporter outer membrane factor (OMF) lipoprotein
VSLDVAWEPDLWGRLSAEQRAAEHDLVASAADLAGARLSVAAGTAKAWLAWQEGRLQLELAERSVASYERTEELVRRRFEGGVADLLDVHLANANASGARALAAARGDTAERAARQLEILLGRYPAGALEAPTALPATPPPPPAGVPGTLIARRPDLAAAEARLFAGEERLRVARANLYPSLRLAASVGRTSNELGDLIDPDFSVWSILASLAQPILQGGRLRAGVDLADARLQEVVAAFESQLLVALNEVESQLQAESFLATWEAEQERAAEEARAAQEIAESRYDAGLADLLTVLEAQRRALDAQSQHLNVRHQRLARRVDLHLALGGGFESPETTP